MRQPLTKKQRAIFDFLARHIRDRGYAPTIVEVGRVFALTSTATVHKHLEAIREKGYITRRVGHARALEIAPPDDCCPTCGRKLDEKAKDGAAA